MSKPTFKHLEGSFYRFYPKGGLVPRFTVSMLDVVTVEVRRHAPVNHWDLPAGDPAVVVALRTADTTDVIAASFEARFVSVPGRVMLVTLAGYDFTEAEAEALDYARQVEQIVMRHKDGEHD